MSLGAVAREALLANGFVPEAGDDVVREVASLRDAPTKGIKDLRALKWSSIDNATSRDLDQIEVAEELSDGAVLLRIGIADVDALVPQGSAIDAHAFTNATSVYTGVSVYPMLPEKLSTDLTSLNEGEDRLVMVIELEIAADGAVRRHDVYRALATNHAKLAYESVGAWLEGRGPEPDKLVPDDALEAQIWLQDRAASLLKRVRLQAGALEFETVEATPVAKDGRVEALAVTRKNRARDLIEDFMIAANVAIARLLAERGRSAIRRVVRVPRRWDRIVTIARDYGFTLTDQPNALALSSFLGQRRAADPTRFADLSLSIVKLLGPGEYVLDEPGPSDDQPHFGLAATDYTHATAPNRRYADLVTQRLVKAAIAGAPPPYNDAELAAIARQCTERENAANRVERTTRKAAAAELLSHRIGAVFRAIVTGVKKDGTYVRLLSPPAEGRVVRGEEGMDVGEQVRVRLVRTDPERGHIDFGRTVFMVEGFTVGRPASGGSCVPRPAVNRPTVQPSNRLTV